MFKNWEEKRFAKLLVKREVQAKETKKILAGVLASLPDDLVDFIDKEIVFIDGRDNYRNYLAYVSVLNSKESKQIIYLNPNFFLLDQKKQQYVIMREIGHIYLDHNLKKDHSFADYKKREQEVDFFVVEHGFATVQSPLSLFSSYYVQINFYEIFWIILCLLLVVLVWYSLFNIRIK